jgi:hypothetical protein
MSHLNEVAVPTRLSSVGAVGYDCGLGSIDKGQGLFLRFGVTLTATPRASIMVDQRRLHPFALPITPHAIMIVSYR